MNANPTESGLSRRSVLEAGAAGLLATGVSGRLPFAQPVDGTERGLHHRPRAHRIIYLTQTGGPAQHELFDPKPLLDQRHGEELPPSVRRGQRLTTMSANQSSFPLARSVFQFAQHGESGAWVSELLPHTARIADRLCFVKSMWTDAINHDPALTKLLSGAPLAGRPSLGAWLHYGLGGINPDLPASVVLITKNKGGQPLYARLWGSGFLPNAFQGVPFRAGAEPVLYLEDPPGITRASRRDMLNALRALHRHGDRVDPDPRWAARVANYELAYRLQESVPEAMDWSQESDETMALYGTDARTPGTFAANCLLARRLIERGVRFVQLFHQGWDQHGGLPGGLRRQCNETDQGAAALVLDLERRGLLDDTIVVWGGEFGRTAYCQGTLTKSSYGRDHHPRCFTKWIAGGGFRAGTSYGETDEFGYNVVSRPVSIHDLHATLLYALGIDHERLTYAHQGRSYRLTDVHGRVVRDILA